jgi:hypothetical protein
LLSNPSFFISSRGFIPSIFSQKFSTFPPFQAIFIASVLMFVFFLQVRSQNYEKRLLALSRLSVRMEQLGSHWTDFDET